HPQRGLLMPGSFITVAEDRGLLADIGDWIITELSRNQQQLAEWGHQPQMAVNVAVSQFEQVDFVARLWRLLERYQADPSRIEIEVTERSMLSDFEAAHYKLKELKSLGLKIALDDFGSGYSSLGYLQHLDIDTLKMDRSLIISLDEKETDTNVTSRSRAITRSIITLGKNLGLLVIAEGVENEAQMDYLRENGCDSVQGYLISKPLSLDDLHVWLDARAEVPVL
ncbi:MAG: EAL domain-containing protein, partial [Anaerolineae bacterium]|nr:EAL domain-containing protein [Anaerolineae bacterium]